MKELRHTVPAAELKDFDPLRMVHDLTAKGFKFEHENCPIKFAGDGGVTRNPDGSVTFRQTVEEGGQ